MTETDKKIARLYSELAEAYRIINNLEKENKKNTNRYAGKSYEEAKSKQDIAKIVDELYETANDDQKCILCELYQRIIRLPNVEPKAECDDTIAYNDDFATALEKISKYEDRKACEEWQNGYDTAWEEAKVFYEVQECEDAVSRQAVYILVDSILAEQCENSTELGLLQSWGKEQVDKLQSVQPKAKVGHWIIDDTEHGHCSICEHKEDLMDGKSSYGWCGNCGARMVEE